MRVPDEYFSDWKRQIFGKRSVIAYACLSSHPALNNFTAYAETTLDRDRYQAPEEALAFGLIDQVIERRPEPPPIA